MKQLLATLLALTLFIFSSYSQISEDNEINQNFTHLIIKTIEESGLEKAKTIYQMRNKNENLLEFVMRNEGFAHLDNNMPDIAVRIFEMNVFAYPASAEALQGLGEGYMETGKKELALKYYKQSLSINPDNPFVKRMVKKLEE
jgi:tetratricopeptide (TPR) repeat protein